MNAATDFESFASPALVLQPCSEACAGYRAYGKEGWRDYGLCGNPDSPSYGYPVRIGRECRYYRSTGGPPPPAPAATDRS